MPPEIQLLSHSIDTVNFLVDTKRYTFPELDGLLIKHIVALSERAPGKAFNIAKKYKLKEEENVTIPDNKKFMSRSC